MKSNQLFNLTCFVLFIVFFLNSFCTKAQNRCNANQFMQLQLKQHPDILTEKATLDKLVMAKMQQLNNQKQKKQSAIVSIPVVFHVLYNNSEEDISFEQLESQIAVLNEDYRRTNDDATNTWSQAADTQIEFSLASIDLNGDYFEGVTRTMTTKTYFSPDGLDMFSSATGGKDIWPDYLNIYVCNLDLFIEGVLGIAPFPGYFSAYDGVVLDYRVVGRKDNPNQNYVLIDDYNLGRTATHEVGHWLDLEHMWGAGDGSCSTDDNITDTPKSEAPYYACNEGSTCGSLDMSENFMDYHIDSCMNLFTQGQSNKMAASINIYRPYLYNHTKSSSCLPSVNIAVNFEATERSIISNNTITATNDILNNCEVNYSAKNRVTLNNGFSIDESSNFTVRIVGNCGG